MNVSLETVLRCLDLIPIIRENQGIELAELARRTAIPEKIIARQLLPMLLLCGAPPYLPHDYVSVWLEDDRVYCGFAEHFRRPVTLLPIELVALHQALSAVRLAAESNSETAQRLGELAVKIERALPAEQRIFLDQADRVVVEDFQESPHLADVTAAVHEKRKIEIDYISFGETRPKTRVIHPYGIVVKDGLSYVPSFDEVRGHIVTFRIDRIMGLRSKKDRFEIPADFSLERWVKEGFAGPARPSDEHQLVCSIKGRTARWTAEVFEPSRWVWKDEETLILTLPTSRLLSAVRWVLTLGPDAEVIAPPAARTMALEEIKALRALYAKK